MLYPIVSGFPALFFANRFWDGYALSSEQGGALVEKVAAMVKERKPEGISDMRDESDRQGMRTVLGLRANVQPRIVLNSLYKFRYAKKGAK